MFGEYPHIFDEDLRRTILAAKPDDLWANWQGVMFGNGRVWFHPGGEDLAIVTINPPFPQVAGSTERSDNDATEQRAFLSEELSARYEVALKAAGVPYTVSIDDKGGHVFAVPQGTRKSTHPAIRDFEAWLQKWLKSR